VRGHSRAPISHLKWIVTLGPAHQPGAAQAVAAGRDAFSLDRAITSFTLGLGNARTPHFGSLLIARFQAQIAVVPQPSLLRLRWQLKAFVEVEHGCARAVGATNVVSAVTVDGDVKLVSRLLFFWNRQGAREFARQPIILARQDRLPGELAGAPVLDPPGLLVWRLASGGFLEGCIDAPAVETCWQLRIAIGVVVELIVVVLQCSRRGPCGLKTGAPYSVSRVEDRWTGCNRFSGTVVRGP